MKEPIEIVVFTLDERRFALALSTVEKIHLLAEITPLPKAPDCVLGLVNVHGNIVPVVNIRMRFGIPERETGLTDKLIVARTARRTMALVVDDVAGVLEIDKHEIVSPRDILPETEYVAGVVKLPDGMIFIHDLDAFLSLEEEKRLDDALREPA